MRTLNDTNLGTREARLKLKAEKRHWRQIDPGLHLGYRRGPRGGKWLMRAYTDQRRYRLETVGIADDFGDADGDIILSFAHAQRIARERFVRMQRIAKHLDPDISRGKYTVNNCLDDYLAAHEDNSWYYDVKKSFEVHVRPVLGHTAVQDLTTLILQEWLKEDAKILPRVRERHYNPRDGENVRKRKNTTNTCWIYFRAALNNAWRMKGYPSDAWDRVQKFENVDPPKYRFFTIEESRRLVAAASSDFAELLRGALVTGARSIELARLLVGDFNEENRTVHIVNGKGGKSRHVVLNDEGVVFFRRMTEGRQKDERVLPRSYGLPWSRRAIVNEMHLTLDDAGIAVPRGTAMHACRHTYCSWALMSGMGTIALAKNLGHADTRQIERVYGHLTHDFMRDEILEHVPVFGFETSVAALRVGSTAA